MPGPESASGWVFEAIGAPWRVDAPAPIGADARAAVQRCVERVDRAWSRFRTDSLVARLAAAGGSVTVDDADAPLLDLYAELEERTGGAFSPLVGDTLADLGYDADYSLTPRSRVRDVPPPGTWRWSPPLLTVDRPTTLDVGAGGKGHLVDLVTAELARHGHAQVTVDGSGDLLHRGDRPLRVALEHPADPTSAVAVVELPPGRALAASATNRRTWGDGLHHVLDGRTGRPVDGIVATWVVAATCLEADALATALFVAAPEVVLAGRDVEWAVLDARGRLVRSPGLAAEVFTA